MRQETAVLIAASYSRDEAAAYLQFAVEHPHLQQLADIGREILDHCPPVPGACAHMTAVWVSLVRDRTKLPAYQVAGDLLVDGHMAFGSDADAVQIASSFSSSQSAWDGHCWLAVGDHIGDLSIFRTAYALSNRSRLRATIIRHFGKGRGLMLFPERDLHRVELQYVPKYVVTKAQIDSLVLGAREIFTAR